MKYFYIKKFSKYNIYYVPLTLAHTWINPILLNITIHKATTTYSPFACPKHLYKLQKQYKQS